MSYYIGLLSGTSVDSIDAAIVSISENQIHLIKTQEQSFSPQLKEKIQQLIKSQHTSLSNLANIDHEIAIEFSIAVTQLIESSIIDKKDIVAIGSHGQTIYHQPNIDDENEPNTFQIGSAHVIAACTGIDVVCNFRKLDLAYSGQGAPLAPLLHDKLYAKSNINTAVVNLGGIANISFIGQDFENIIGYDSGPANCLIDEWIGIHQQKSFDENGNWAKNGVLNKNLLNKMLDDSYFKKPAPKSTGREYFNYQWYDNFKQEFKNISAQDIQTTLTHLTAKSIANEIKSQTCEIDEIIVLGGGAYNDFLIELIENYSNTKVIIGENAQWVEAILFAYLADQRINNIKLNLSSITGSTQPIMLGDIINCS